MTNHNQADRPKPVSDLEQVIGDVQAYQRAADELLQAMQIDADQQLPEDVDSPVVSQLAELPPQEEDL